MNKEKCPCGSKKYFAECCDLCISGKQPAKTPEALMRSRYSAYSKANIAYIQATMHGSAAQGFNPDTATQWAKQAQWLGLKVIRSEQESDSKGYVEFIARYKLDQQPQAIHECSEFHRIDSRWYYVDGKRCL